jgi:hypothetical protein
MATIQNDEFFTLKLYTSENAVRCLCLPKVTNMTGHLKMADWLHLGHSPQYQLKSDGNKLDQFNLYRVIIRSIKFYCVIIRSLCLIYILIRWIYLIYKLIRLIERIFVLIRSLGGSGGYLFACYATSGSYTQSLLLLLITEFWHRPTYVLPLLIFPCDTRRKTVNSLVKTLGTQGLQFLLTCLLGISEIKLT